MRIRIRTWAWVASLAAMSGEAGGEDSTNTSSPAHSKSEGDICQVLYYTIFIIYYIVFIMYSNIYYIIWT